MPTAQEAARELRQQSAAVRLHWTFWCPTKAMDGHHKAEVAGQFEANVRSVTAGKKLFDTRNPHYRALTSLKNEITAVWQQATLPYTEPGVRLIRRGLIPDFDRRMGDFKEKFDEAVASLAANYEAIKGDARERLGRLFNASDYPEDIRGKFAFAWDFPNLAPPDYLMNLNPRLYEQEQERVRLRFEEAVRQAEDAFAAQLAGLVEHLSERLKPGEDGRKKVFRDSAVDNLKEFFATFRGVSVRSSAELDALVGQTERLFEGVDAGAIRRDASARDRVERGLSQVREQLEGLVTTQRRRAWRQVEGSPVPAGDPEKAPEETSIPAPEPEGAAA